MDSVGAFIVFFAALFAVAERDNITGGLAGVALTYAIQVSKQNFSIDRIALAQPT